MKRYKVITNQLEWFGLKVGDIFSIDSRRSSSFVVWVDEKTGVDVTTSLCGVLNYAFSNPLWFKVILELPDIFTKKDMLEFGEYLMVIDEKNPNYEYLLMEWFTHKDTIIGKNHESK
jgi:hypothetical protein